MMTIRALTPMKKIIGSHVLLRMKCRKIGFATNINYFRSSVLSQNEVVKVGSIDPLFLRNLVCFQNR